MSERDDTIRRLQNEIAALESRLDSGNQLIVALRNQLQAHESQEGDDRRNQIYRRAAIDILPNEAAREFSNVGPVMLKDMRDALVAISSRLDHKFAESRAISEVTERINTGMFFSEVLDHIYEHFQVIVPYDRIGVAVIEESEAGRTLVRSHWNRAKYTPVLVGKGYAAVLERSSLQEIANTRQPRILNDLDDYLESHPKSASTRLIVKEGIRSSLTCPLVTRNTVIGFIFFSSLKSGTYQDEHIELYSQVAGELALTLEKSRAYEDLYLRNEFIKKVFGQYVTNEVAEAALSTDGPLTLGGVRRKVTVLMADLRGFTPMSEVLSPEEVVDALNIYLGTMAEIVMKWGGSIDNFIGDALMAVFGVPFNKQDDTARAVACAIEMQNSMANVNVELEGRNLPQLQMGIGLSTGEAVAGNIGSEMRVKYSVIGSMVNLAARIEGVSSGGQVFSCDTTFQELREIVHTVGHLNVKLKGLSQPALIYEIIGIGGKYEVHKL